MFKCNKFFFFAACSNGHFSKISLSFLINFKKFEFATKNPPLIQLLVVCGFSLNEITLFFLSNMYSQWEYVLNKSEKKIEAVGEVFYNETYKDSIILKLSKSRNLEKRVCKSVFAWCAK